MLSPWPLFESDAVLREALDIAMDYLEFTGQAYIGTERICANTILRSWRRGTKHRIRLANDAIVAIEKSSKPIEIASWQLFYPRVS